MMKSVERDWQAPSRQLRAWGGKAFMVVVIVVTGIGLSRFEFPAARPSRELETEERGGSGIIIHHELVHAWLPATLSLLRQTSV